MLASLTDLCPTQILMMKTTTTRKILHIDDDADDHELLRKAIYSIDSASEIIEATDGADGIERLNLMKATNDLPCLIVLDINMPKVNGRDACVQIKKDRDLAAIPMIIFSTSNSKLDKLFFETKNVEYITKPTDYDVLVSLASRMLGQCQTA